MLSGLQDYKGLAAADFSKVRKYLRISSNMTDSFVVAATHHHRFRSPLEPPTTMSTTSAVLMTTDSEMDGDDNPHGRYLSSTTSTGGTAMRATTIIYIVQRQSIICCKAPGGCSMRDNKYCNGIAIYSDQCITRYLMYIRPSLGVPAET